MNKYSAIDPISYHASRIAESATATIMLSAEYPYPCVRAALYHLMSLIENHPNHMSPEARALMLMVRAIELSSGISRWPSST
jgi:hypothetical protein